MQGTWFEALRDRWRSTWDVLTGRAYAAYSAPDIMGEVRLRMALVAIQQKIANRSFINTVEIRSTVEAALDDTPDGVGAH